MNVKSSLFDDQVKKLQEKYQALKFIKRAGDRSIHGRILVEAEFEGKAIICDYEIKICVPKDYPVSVPKVFELHGKIEKDFHRFKNGELCLGAPHAVSAKFHQNRTLLGFVDEHVVPYLFSHAYFLKTGEMPFGELEHDDNGIYQYYCEKFKTNNTAQIKGYLLNLLNMNSGNKRNMPCFCGNGNLLAECHSSDFHYYEEVRSNGDLKMLIDGICNTLDNVEIKRRREFERSVVRVLCFGSSIKTAIGKITRSRILLPFFNDERSDNLIIDSWYEELTFKVN